MAANVLVVANLTANSQHLLDALRHRAERSPIRVTLVMPASGPGLAGREAVKARLDEALEGMRAAGLEAEGAIGDADPMEAVAECFDAARHDEAIVCTLPGRRSSATTCVTGTPVNRATRCGKSCWSHFELRPGSVHTIASSCRAGSKHSATARLWPSTRRADAATRR